MTLVIYTVKTAAPDPLTFPALLRVFPPADDPTLLLFKKLEKCRFYQKLLLYEKNQNFCNDF